MLPFVVAANNMLEILTVVIVEPRLEISIVVADIDIEIKIPDVVDTGLYDLLVVCRFGNCLKVQIGMCQPLSRCMPQLIKL